MPGSHTSLFLRACAARSLPVVSGENHAIYGEIRVQHFETMEPSTAVDTVSSATAVVKRLLWVTRSSHELLLIGEVVVFCLACRPRYYLPWYTGMLHLPGTAAVYIYTRPGTRYTITKKINVYIKCPIFRYVPVDTSKVRDFDRGMLSIRYISPSLILILIVERPLWVGAWVGVGMFVG